MFVRLLDVHRTVIDCIGHALGVRVYSTLIKYESKCQARSLAEMEVTVTEIDFGLVPLVPEYEREDVTQEK